MPSKSIVQRSSIEKASSSFPDWIHAVSKSFYVGTGHGKTIDEARRAALNDIKSFILSSIGETGSVSEINIVQNETTGRKSNKALEAYMNRNTFKNEFKPVINISTANFEDYYWAEGLNKASYYIKYRVDENALKKIRQKCLAAIEKHKSDQVALRKRIDSLSSINDLNFVEELCLRKEKLLNLFNASQNPTKYDSIKIINGIYRLNQILNNLSFKILNDTLGHIEFVLESEGKILRSKHIPWLNSNSEISLTNVHPLNMGWFFKFKLPPYDMKTHNVTINLEFPNLDIRKNIDIKNERLIPRLELKDGVQFAISQYNFWKDKAQKGTIRLMLFANFPMTLQRIEILPMSLAGTDALISCDNPAEVFPGNNMIEFKSMKVFPVSFIKRLKICDVKLYYQINGQIDFLTLKSIPFNTMN